MKRKILSIIAVATFAIFASCNKTNIQPSEVKGDKITIEAYNADYEQDTKTMLAEDNRVMWNPNDSISVFFGEYAVPFYSYNSKPVTRANFIGTALITQGNNAEYDESSEDYAYWGVYPLQTHNFKYITSKYDGGVACFVDEEQEALDGTFNRSTFVTVARSNDYSKLAFYNLCGGVRFKLSSSDIEMVTFCGNNGEALAGEVVVKMDQEGHPFAEQRYAEIGTIRLSAPDGGTFKPGVWYYIVSLPSELAKGFTMKFISKSENKMATLTTSNGVNIQRSHFGSLDCPDAGLEYVEYDNSEDKSQLRNEIYIKSVTRNGNDFSIELGFPTISVKKLFDKVKFTYGCNKLGDDASSNRSVAITESLFKIGITTEIDYRTYQKLSNEEQYLINFYGENFPNCFYYSTKSENFMHIDSSSDDEAYLSWGRGEYMGTVGNNNFFQLDRYWNASYIHKIFSIEETSESVTLKEWADYSSLYFGNGEYYDGKGDAFTKLWLEEGLYPVAFCNDGDGNYTLATFPEAGVTNTMTVEESSYMGNRLLNAGKTLYWLYSNNYDDSLYIRSLTFKDGLPVISDRVKTGLSKNRYQSLEPKAYNMVVLYSADWSYEHHDEYLPGYIKLNEGGVASVGTFPSILVNSDYRDYSAWDRYLAKLAYVYYDGHRYEKQYKLLKFDFISEELKEVMINLPEFTGYPDSHSGIYNGHFVFVFYMIQASDGKEISFIIDCDTETTSIESGRIELGY